MYTLRTSNNPTVSYKVGVEVAQEEGQSLQIPLVRVGLEDVPIQLANDFVIQHQQNEFILSIGQYQPPILLGTSEERREQAERISYVPIRTVARIGLTRQRLVELIKILQDNLQRYDVSQAEGREQ